MAVGYIYILSNPAMPGLLKVGYTCDAVDARVKQLTAATGVPAPFVVEHFVLTRDVAEIEALVHAELTEHRAYDNREFFRSDLRFAVGTVERLARAPQLKSARNEEADANPANDLDCPKCMHRYDVNPGTRYAYCRRCQPRPVPIRL